MSPAQRHVITLFRGTRNTTPLRTVEASWAELVALGGLLSAFVESPSKEARNASALMFGPYTAPLRNDASASGLNLAVFDYDFDASPADVAETRRLLAADGVAQHWYSSYSYAPVSKEAWRLVVPLSAPVALPAWKPLRSYLVSRYRLRVQPGRCESYSHAYFLPVCPPGAIPSLYSSSGGLFDTSLFLATVPQRAPVRPVTEGPVREDLEPLRERLRERAMGLRLLRCEEAKVKAHLLEAVANGESIVDGKTVRSDSGDPPAARAAALVVNAVWGETLDTYLELLAPSIEATRATGRDLPERKVESMVRSAMQKRQQFEDTQNAVVGQMAQWAEGRR
jgi:hypothetical protein